MVGYEAPKPSTKGQPAWIVEIKALCINIEAASSLAEDELSGLYASRLQCRTGPTRQHYSGFSDPTQICTRVPSSTTQLCGSLKKSATLPALRDIVAKSASRQWAIPAPRVGTTISRLRK